MAAGFWASCYALQPSKTVARPLVQAAARSQRGASMQRAYDLAMARATATVQRMSWLRQVHGDGAARSYDRNGGIGGRGGSPLPCLHAAMPAAADMPACCPRPCRRRASTLAG